MEWIERLNDAVKYMEEHLEENIDLEKVSKIACCSAFHFQRMFSYIAEIPLSEYIRRRRMTKAAFDLISSEIRVIDAALKYGYDSPTAFTRAFKTVHGIAPSEAKELGTQIKAFPPISFKIIVKGDAEMNYKIVRKDSFRIVGVKEHYLLNVEENFAQVPIFWQKAFQDGTIPKICELMDQEPYAVLGVSTCMKGGDFNYYIAAATSKETPEGFEDYIVPEGTWAVFECTGKDIKSEMQTLQKRIVTEWLPTSGYEYADAPDIEVYYNPDPSGNVRCESWVPIVKK